MKHYTRVVIAALAMYALVCVVLLAYCGIAARDAMRYRQRSHTKKSGSQDNLQAKKV